MRVLFFNYEYPPLGGGAANATSYILREFSKIHDLSVDLVTSSIDGQYHLEEIGVGIKIHRLPIGKNEKNLHFQSQKDLLVYAWKAFWFSQKLAKENNYDLSHSFFTVPCGFISLILKKRFKIPYIVSLRGADVPGYSERFIFLYKIIVPLVKLIWKNASHVISNSEGLKNLALRTKPNQKIGVIYNGVNIEEFNPLEDKQNDKFKVICVSRITARKGINYLIEATDQLVKKNYNIELEIVGEGNEKAKLEKMVEKLELGNHVKFLGIIPHNELPALYSQADIFVLPSLNEGMSNTVLEALASGLPIVATDTGGTRELLSGGDNGFIVKMKNSEDLMIKIGRIMRDGDLQKRMSQRSREVAESMSWEKVAKQYYDLYKVVNDN